MNSLQHRRRSQVRLRHLLPRGEFSFGGVPFLEDTDLRLSVDQTCAESAEYRRDAPPNCGEISVSTVFRKGEEMNHNASQTKMAGSRTVKVYREPRDRFGSTETQ